MGWGCSASSSAGGGAGGVQRPAEGPEPGWCEWQAASGHVTGVLEAWPSPPPPDAVRPRRGRAEALLGSRSHSAPPRLRPAAAAMTDNIPLQPVRQKKRMDSKHRSG
ncbi:transcriptional adapter 1 [Platysternon megacephalum]|uniref:Transcriptional adapter 1 n=1 Tax=Platysternon megacephalum TaxID=55544 RepID=A0A4D9EKT1_9SAUR|nr:transcriptional adapter 1 [Platysternon megacephalum]